MDDRSLLDSRAADVQRAVDVLRAGGLVGLPTETVYGLAADAENELAVRRIFAVKRRPSTHPLIVHLADAADLDGWAREIPARAGALARAFWPGPLTLVLRRTARASDAVTGGQDTVALRVPAHPLARAVLGAFGGGLAAPSANRFGKVSPTRAEHVRADLADEVDLILDGGASAVGLESTILDLTGERPTLLRPGGVTVEQLETALGERIETEVHSQIRAPGLLPSHYAPRAGVLLASAQDAVPRALELARSGARVAVAAPAAVEVPEGLLSFVVPEDAARLGRELYLLLRALDAAAVDVAVVVAPDETGLGVAVLDRLRRAAAPRG